jgi:hypothetical protein
MALNRSILRIETSASSRRLTLQEQLLALQWTQLKHDEVYHKEIVLLPVSERMKHFALHIAKYLGYLAEASETHDEQRFEHTLVDAFIISIASANAIGCDLGETLACPRGGNTDDNLKGLGCRLADGLGYRECDPTWLIKQFARIGGRLAKACESLDHLEAYPFREEMRASVIDLVKLVMAEASLRNFDLAARSRNRLEGVESRNLFHRYYIQNQG